MQSYPVLQQSDIDGAAHDLESSNNPDPQQTLQGQLKANERMIGTPSCKPNVSSDHQAGDKVANVTVSVKFTCTGTAYDLNSAAGAAAQQLKAQAATDPGDGYVLAGDVATTVRGAQLTDNGAVNATVTASGTWIFQLSDAQKQDWAQKLAGKSKNDAQSFLQGQKGVKGVDIQLPDNDQKTFPSDASKITFDIKTA